MSGGLRIAVFFFLAGLVVLMWGATFVAKRHEHVASGVARLPPRSFDSLSLVVLGSGGSFENHLRLGPALAVAYGESALLLDAGRGVAEALRAAEFPVWQPRHVFLSSLQPENTVGLDDLWLTARLADPAQPLRVFGPPGTAELVRGLQSAFAAPAAAQAADWALAPIGAGIAAQELRGGERIAVGALQLRATALRGGLAFRIEHGGKVIAAALAGTDRAAVVRAAANADVLVLEAISGESLAQAAEAGAERVEILEREARNHWRLEEAGSVAAEAGARALALVRLRPPPVFNFQYERVARQSFRGPVLIAADSQVIAP